MLRSIDTNVLVRFLVDDGSRHVARARAAIRASDIFVPATVLLEAEWILRSRYRLSVSEINRLLTSFIDLPNVTPEHANLVRRALAAHLNGLDFADAVHLHLSISCDVFLSFDKRLVSRSRILAGVPSVQEP